MLKVDFTTLPTIKHIHPSQVIFTQNFKKFIGHKNPSELGKGKVLEPLDGGWLKVWFRNLMQFEVVNSCRNQGMSVLIQLIIICYKLSQ